MRFMFNTNNLRKEPLIAGSSSGKPVRITPAAKSTYDQLLRLARGGNHWARLTVKGINELVAGRLHQNNIFMGAFIGSSGNYNSNSFLDASPYDLFRGGCRNISYCHGWRENFECRC